VEKKGTTRNSVDPKVLREGRVLNMPLLQNQKPPQKKEDMCTWILQSHMQIMRHAWLYQIHPFI
jgi:hypothetical protein